MAETGYSKIVEHYERCLEEFGDTPKGVDWPNEKDAIKRYEIMLDVVNKGEECSLLDFGCGAGHMLEYMMKKTDLLSHITYSGLDISQKFIDLCNSKFPMHNFVASDVLKDPNENSPMYDYIILNGVFTEKRELSFDEMWNYCQSLLSFVFSKCNSGIAFNVMSKAVDWERDDLFHLSKDLLVNFLVTLSRKFVIRNDYGLYEYTVYLYK